MFVKAILHIAKYALLELGKTNDGVYMPQFLEIHVCEEQWHALLEKKKIDCPGFKTQNSLPLSYRGRPGHCFLKFFFLWKRICTKKGQRFLCQYEKDVTKSLVQLFSLSCEPSVFQELKREQSSDLRWLRLFYWRTTLAHVCVNKPNDLSFSGLLNCVILPCLAVSQLNKITDRKTRSRGRRSLPCFSLDSRNWFSRLL